MLSFVGRRAFVRERILESAFDLFAKEGYEAVSTRDIAAAAEVGPASMFKHFPTKEDLGRELYRVAIAPIAKDFAELAAAKPDARSAVRETVRLLYAAYDKRPRALALLIFPPHEFTPAEVDPAESTSVRAIVQRLMKADDDLAAIVWGAVTGPLQDRYLRRRTGTMSPHAVAHAERIVLLLTKTGA
jgi:AcrR family transcriptional regulator